MAVLKQNRVAGKVVPADDRSNRPSDLRHFVAASQCRDLFNRDALQFINTPDRDTTSISGEAC